MINGARDEGTAPRGDDHPPAARESAGRSATAGNHASPRRPDAASSVRAGRDPRRRRALLEAADRIILREGPEASMAAIASEAGISKPILYRHFGDKSGLYQALAERHTRALMDAVRTAFLRPGDIRTRSRAAIDTYLAAIAANRHLYRFLVHRASAEDTATHSAMGTVIRGLGGEIAEILLREGLLPDPVRVHIWSHATVGMVQAAGEWWLDHPEVPRETVTDGIVDLLLDGLPEATRR
ncbi:TetR/AcrR family transcriptional regulator [Actinoallomurus purpureus]|uniref:TetR/AcrR family transcriptional regulator n=1 Tax=Actinoallomurus purpureus TaxID=478114 RepID=UPI0027E31B93|nr:TetR/AcrR family transcriptional regulator [Actinoallomurus purpureus]